MNVDYTAEIKFLGIQIMDTLKRHSHVQLLAGKLCKVAFMMSEFDSKKLLYKISLTSPVWYIIFGGSRG